MGLSVSVLISRSATTPFDGLRAKRPKRLPTVLPAEETLRFIGCLSGTCQLMAKLGYGSGLWISLPAQRPGVQISQRRPGMGLAIRVLGHAPVQGFSLRRHPPSSFA